MHPVSIGKFFDILTLSQKAYGQQLEPVCRKWDLTRSEVDVLLYLYNNPDHNRSADIVTRRGMAKSHVSMSVSSLEQQGLLERQFSEADRRTAHLHLTERGCVIAAEARQHQQAFFCALYEGVSDEDLKAWERTTRMVRENIEAMSK